jgi:hypothetical protein
MIRLNASKALDAKTIVTLVSTPTRAEIAKMDSKSCGAINQLPSGLPASRLITGFLNLGKSDGLKLCPVVRP